MLDKNKSKQQLIEELIHLREKVIVLEKLEKKHKQVEESLRESEERFRRMADNIQDGLGIFENDRIVFVNKRLCEITGYSKEELLKLNPLEIIDSEQRDEVQINYEKYKQTGFVPSQVEYKIVRKDGTKRIILARHSVSRFDNDILGYYDIFTDITEQKRIEEALQESEERFRVVAQSATDAIIFVDSREKIQFWNQSAKRLYGYREKEILGQPATILLSKSRRKIDERKFAELISSGKDSLIGKTVESIGLRKDGTEFPTETSFSVGQTGDQTFYCGITRDISQRKEYEEKLENLNKELALRVKERTEDLEKVNEQLKKEISERIQTGEELKTKKNTLEELNAALRVLLDKRDQDRKELAQNVVYNVKELVLPNVEKLMQSPLDQQQREYLKIVNSNLNDIISPFGRTLSLTSLNLTPREIYIANLIREGKTTKEIAELMHLSVRTIDSHRDNIRKKLGLKSKKANLRSHLLAIENT